MNRTISYVAENALQMRYAIRARRSSNPFRHPSKVDLSWVEMTPDEFYAVPEEPPQVVFTPLIEQPDERLARFSYASPYTSPHPENNVVHGLADLHPDGESRAALIFLHGHMMTRPTIFPMLWFSRQIVSEGVDLYYINLPYHMRRKLNGSWSGQYALNSDIYGSAMAFRQGVQDVRALITWITEVKKIPVALAGISLGAFTACMTSVVDPRPRAVLSLLGGANLARILWDGYMHGVPRRQLLRGGVTSQQHEHWWRLLSPGNWKTHLQPENILMIAGRFDQVVTPQNVSTLWRAWDKPRLRWLRCGHITSTFYHREIAQEIAKFHAEVRARTDLPV